VKRVAILISGGGSNMLELVRDMAGDHPARAVLVVSNDPNATGLGRATALGIPTIALDHRAFATRADFDAALAQILHDAYPDIICLAGFMRILTPDFITQFQGRMLNIHPSLLPKYPGLHTHQRALDAGDTHAGCTVHLVTADLDAGPILGQSQVEIMAADTAESLAAKVLICEHRLYPDTLRAFAASLAGPNRG
jgi:phosphoribosylglycinamide formyltransferase-1